MSVTFVSFLRLQMSMDLLAACLVNLLLWFDFGRFWSSFGVTQMYLRLAFTIPPKACTCADSHPPAAFSPSVSLK